MVNLSDQAQAARRAYKREYRQKNKDKINAYTKEWYSRPENAGKRQQYEAKYWENVAQQEAVTHG